jgi:hypothetical protein
VDSVGGVLQITSESGDVQEWRMATRPMMRARIVQQPPRRLEREVTFRAEASIREIDGSPLVHGVEVPRITGRSTCHVRISSTRTRGLDPSCEMSVECDGVPLYTDEGHCVHSHGSLRSFADYEASWITHNRRGRRTPVAVFDATLGVVRLADQDRERGFAMTLELVRPAWTGPRDAAHRDEGRQLRYD